jgi:sec-independent protein translocase protein TatA
MVGDILQPTHLLFVLVVALLVLGPKRLPEVARQLGNGLRDFRSAISGEDRPEHDSADQVLSHPDEPHIDEHPDMSTFHGDHAETVADPMPIEHAESSDPIDEHDEHEPPRATPQPVAPHDKPA